MLSSVVPMLENLPFSIRYYEKRFLLLRQSLRPHAVEYLVYITRLTLKSSFLILLVFMNPKKNSTKKSTPKPFVHSKMPTMLYTVSIHLVPMASKTKKFLLYCKKKILIFSHSTQKSIFLQKERFLKMLCRFPQKIRKDLKKWYSTLLQNFLFPISGTPKNTTPIRICIFASAKLCEKKYFFLLFRKSRIVSL